VIRLGRWQDALDDIDVVDAVICDPPYSGRTHDGHNGGAEQMVSATGQATRQSLEYGCMTPVGVHELVQSWAPRTRGWFACMTSHDLIPHFEAAYAAAGLYSFSPVVIVQKRPRLLGDGPSNWSVYLMVARPRNVLFSRWGCLPGAYFSTTAKVAGIAGAKPLDLMRAIVRDYSRPGNLVCDPFAGSGTTALACESEGRRCITSEADPATFAIARARLEVGVTRDMFTTELT
jgi:site-specific DNA-methyltransferase (adenine-specific)